MLVPCLKFLPIYIDHEIGGKEVSSVAPLLSGKFASEEGKAGLQMYVGLLVSRLFATRMQPGPKSNKHFFFSPS